jgi:hypothetical protein
MIPIRLVQFRILRGSRLYQPRALIDPRYKSQSISAQFSPHYARRDARGVETLYSPPLKPFPHIRSLGTGVSISPIVGIVIRYTHATPHVVSVANTRFFGVHNASMRHEGDTCGCAMLDLHQERKGVHFSSGPSLMMMGIRCGERKPSRTWPLL